MSEDGYEAGMKVRREVLGDEHVDRAIRGTTEFTQPFQELITRFAWGSVWSRDGLDRRTRSAITLAVLTALGRENELAMHVRAARRNGLSDERSVRFCSTPPFTRACRRRTPRSRSPSGCSRSKPERQAISSARSRTLRGRAPRGATVPVSKNRPKLVPLPKPRGMPKD